MQGRDAYQALLHRLIQRARGGAPEVLMLRGDAGIGKSTLLQDLRASVEDAVVISATGLESERHLPLAGLIEMLYPLRSLLNSLESPHREVLIRVVEHGESSTPVALGLAMLHCLD
ncbi:MAG TPA: ATP-binding protein, partial [Ilumatobacteraceae bacterium]|nr:ATP-binding protein [Ilumatobacteraceae bacterium]